MCLLPKQLIISFHPLIHLYDGSLILPMHALIDSRLHSYNAVGSAKDLIIFLPQEIISLFLLCIIHVDFFPLLIPILNLLYLTSTVFIRFVSLFFNLLLINVVSCSKIEFVWAVPLIWKKSLLSNWVHW